MRTLRILAVFAAVCALVPATVRGAISGATRIASAQLSPIFMTHAPGDPNRLFILERGWPNFGTNTTGGIRVLDLTTGTQSQFLTIPGVDNTGEGGALGLAFHPDYQTNGKFYVYLTAGDSDPNTYFSSYVREYTVSADPNVANPPFTPVLSFGQPASNHNGGWIGFSPNDGYLYIMSGDGGGPTGSDNAQDITDNWLGKALRVDVNGDDFPGNTPEALAKNYAVPPTNPMKAGVGDPADDFGDDEIWAFGLRNPFRASFDRATGDLWIGDVGQNAFEEIDLLPASTTFAANLGWPLIEGNAGPGDPLPPNYVDPAYAYGHVSGPFGGRVVIGGYVYRGPDPSLQGKYFFMDSQDNIDPADDNFWMADTNPFGSVTNINSMLTFDAGLHRYPTSFGEDAVGNLYMSFFVSGDVYRINTNQLLPGDYNADGDVNNLDYAVWRSTFGANSGSRPADGNGNGVVDAADYVVWRNNLGASVHAGAGASTTVPELATAIYGCQFAAALLVRRARRMQTQRCGLPI